MSGRAGRALPEAADAVVVGAGLGGLTCALELAARGMKVVVLEQHGSVGGYAHGFKRGDFRFDVSLHHIGSLEPGMSIRRVLDRLGVTGKLRLKRPAVLLTADLPGGRISLPNDSRGLLDELGGRFPAERDGLAALFRFIGALKQEIVGPWLDEEPSATREQPLVSQVASKTFQEILESFVHDRLLLALLGQFWFSIGLPPNRSTALFSTCVFASCFLDGIQEIEGRGQALSAAMAERVEELGGVCATSSPVARIGVVNGQAVSVDVEGRGTVRAPLVVSGADPYQTFHRLVGPAHISEVFLLRLRAMQPSLSAHALYLGLDCAPELLGIPAGNYAFNSGVDLEAAYQRAIRDELEQTDWRLFARERPPEPGLPALGVVSFLELARGADWLELPPEAYRDRKRRLLEQLLRKYGRRFEGLEGHVKAVELGTPRTMARYTRNHLGAIYGLAQTVEQSGSRRLRNRTPVAGLYLTGAWTWAGGGYEGAIMSGVQTAQRILQDGATPRRGTVSVPRATAGALPDSYAHSVRVYPDDVAAGGQVSPVACLRLFDRARVHALDQEGGAARAWTREYTVNVYRIEATFRGGAFLGDRLDVQTRLFSLSSHRGACEQVLCSARTGKTVAEARVELVMLDDGGELVPVPAELQRASPSQALRFGAIPPGAPGSPARRFALRVYYEHTDEQGIVYHASYLRLANDAVYELLDLASPQSPELAQGTIASARIRYVRPARRGDAIDAEISGRRIGERLVLDVRLVDPATRQPVIDAALGLGIMTDEGIRDPSGDAVEAALACLRTD